MKFDQSVNAEEVKNALASEAVFGSAEAKTFGNSSQLKITTKYKIKEENAAVDKEVNEKLYNAVKNSMQKKFRMTNLSIQMKGKALELFKQLKLDLQ